ncbi:MAG: DUF4367 domain-containing protein [Oscillospiraceae bacterium]|nr:DUF4367 domain-containing protein [Oscillospiraceae bacterium]
MMNMAIKNKVFDLVLTEALKEYMDIELQEVDELVAKEPPHEFSLEFEKKMRKTINSVGRKDRIKKYARGCVKMVLSLAAVFGIFFGVLLTQPSVFAAVQNVFRSVFDTHDRYEFVSDELTIENFDNSFRLGYVPDGYYLSEGYYSPVAVTLVYTNKLNEITFEYRIAEGSVSSYDNEHNSYMSFYSNGIEYHYYESNDSDFDDKVIWYESGYEFGIYAHLSKDELIKIAENIEK